MVHLVLPLGTESFISYITFEVFTAVRIHVVIFSVMKPYIPLGGYHAIGGGSMFL
jgi:hypothetical protein